MFSQLIDYTVSSTDPNNYNKIYCNLTAPPTKYSIMTITCLTTNCNIVVLNTNDYIIIDGQKYTFNDNYTNMNLEAFIDMLKQMDNSIGYVNDNTGRLCMYAYRRFVIDDMSYNVKLISGMYHMQFPIESIYDESIDKYIIRAISAGFNMLTPVLYITSNVAVKSYKNIDNDYLCSAKILMRVNNSFSSSMPIIVNNGDFETVLLSNDLSCLEFRLVDANLHDIWLLSPMYLAVQVRPVKDTDVDYYLSSFQMLHHPPPSKEEQSS